MARGEPPLACAPSCERVDHRSKISWSLSCAGMPCAWLPHDIASTSSRARRAIARYIRTALAGLLPYGHLAQQVGVLRVTMPASSCSVACGSPADVFAARSPSGRTHRETERFRCTSTSAAARPRPAEAGLGEYARHAFAKNHRTRPRPPRFADALASPSRFAIRPSRSARRAHFHRRITFGTEEMRRPRLARLGKRDPVDVPREVCCEARLGFATASISRIRPA